MRKVGGPVLEDNGMFNASLEEPILIYDFCLRPTHYADRIFCTIR